MGTLSADTSPEAERVWLDLMRRASPSRKLQLVGQLNQMLRELAMAGLRQRHPEATPEQLRRFLADLLLGPELAATVYGPRDPVENTAERGGGVAGKP